MAAASASDGRTTVDITGTTSVSLSAAATASMAVLEDPVLVHEVTTEALRIALCDKLGGFQGVTVTRPPIADATAPAKATVEFEELSSCIRRLVAAYDALSEKVEELKHPLARLESHVDSLPDEAKAAVKSIREIIETAVSMQDKAEDDARAAAVDATERRKVAAAIDAKQRGEIRRRFAALEDGDDDDATGAVGGFRRGGDASSDDADSSERHRDPADYGYKPLLGSDDGDDADGGAEAADGEEGGAAAAPPPLEDDKGELYG